MMMILHFCAGITVKDDPSTKELVLPKAARREQRFLEYGSTRQAVSVGRSYMLDENIRRHGPASRDCTMH